MALQKGFEDTVRHLLASSLPDIQDQILPALATVLPQAAAPEAAEVSRLQGSLVLHSLRNLAVKLSTEAVKQQTPPMQYALKGAAGPALPRLMSITIACQEHRLVDANSVLYVLEDVQDIAVVEHCLDIITWLEQHRALLSSSSYKSGHQQLIRLCNAIHKRLGKHDVIPRARLLMLIAVCTPLFDRSGLNVMGTFASPDPPEVEDVPADAADSAGKPVDITLYNSFWSLQHLIQDPLKVVKSTDLWETLLQQLDFVLTSLAKSPATVAAVHPAANAAAAGGGSSECYLSSYKLFGLQLADSAFRRGFLVQVLVLLRTLLLPGKQPTETLKEKARKQATDLEKRVYALLEATPSNGREFAAAVRKVLQREETWVEWKNGKHLTLKGQETPAAVAAAGGSSKAGAPAQACAPWSLPPLESLSAAVAAQQAAARQKAAERAAVEREGLSLKRQVDTMGQQYDWEGEPFEKPEHKRKRYLRALGDTSSSLTFWCDAQRQRELAGQPAPLMDGLKVSQQPAYPTAERVCTQMLREMNPYAGIEPECKRVVMDPVYRWRVGRMVAQEVPQYEASLITAAGLESAMMHEAMPPSLRDKVPPEYAAAFNKKKAEEEARKQADKATSRTGKPPPAAAASAAGAKGAAGSGGGTQAAKAAGAGDGKAGVGTAAAAGAAAGAAADAALEAGVAEDDSVVVKQEPVSEAVGDGLEAADADGVVDSGPDVGAAAADANAAAAEAPKLEEGEADGEEDGTVQQAALGAEADAADGAADDAAGDVEADDGEADAAEEGAADAMDADQPAE